MTALLIYGNWEKRRRKKRNYNVPINSYNNYIYHVCTLYGLKQKTKVSAINQAPNCSNFKIIKSECIEENIKDRALIPCTLDDKTLKY